MRNLFEDDDVGSVLYGLHINKVYLNMFKELGKNDGYKISFRYSVSFFSTDLIKLLKGYYFL